MKRASRILSIQIFFFVLSISFVTSIYQIKVAYERKKCSKLVLAFRFNGTLSLKYVCVFACGHQKRTKLIGFFFQYIANGNYPASCCQVFRLLKQFCRDAVNILIAGVLLLAKNMLQFDFEKKKEAKYNYHIVAVAIIFKFSRANI